MGRFAVLYHRVCTVRRGIRSRNRVLERIPLQAMQADAAGNEIFGRRLLFAVLFAATMAGSLALAALALARRRRFRFSDFRFEAAAAPLSGTGSASQRPDRNSWLRGVDHQTTRDGDYVR